MLTTLTGPRFSRSSRNGGKTLVARVFGTWRQRRALSQLDSHALRDLGLTEADVLREAQRPMWDVPHHWR